MSTMPRIPEGTYRAVAVANPNGHYAEIGEAPKAGTPQVVMKFTITDGELQGEQIMWVGSLHGGAAQYTVKSLVACGLTGDDITACETQDLNRDVEIVVGWEEWDGKTRAKIKFINVPGQFGSFEVKKLDSGKKARLTAELRGLMKAQGATAAKPAARPAGINPHAGDDLDI